LANAHAETRDDQLRKVAREARSRGEQAPNEHSACEDETARARIGQPPERKSKDRVEQREDGAKEAKRRVAQSPLAADTFADAADDLAVEEVHEVDREQNDQRVDGAGLHLPGGSEREALGGDYRIGDASRGRNRVSTWVRCQTARAFRDVVDLLAG